MSLGPVAWACDTASVWACDTADAWACDTAGREGGVSWTAVDPYLANCTLLPLVSLAAAVTDSSGMLYGVCGYFVRVRAGMPLVGTLVGTPLYSTGQLEVWLSAEWACSGRP